MKTQYTTFFFSTIFFHNYSSKQIPPSLPTSKNQTPYPILYPSFFFPLTNPSVQKKRKKKATSVPQESLRKSPPENIHTLSTFSLDMQIRSEGVRETLSFRTIRRGEREKPSSNPRGGAPRLIFPHGVA